MRLALPLPDIPLRGQTADSLLIGQAVDRRGGECGFHERSVLIRGLEGDLLRCGDNEPGWLRR